VIENSPFWLRPDGAVQVLVEKMPAGNGAVMAPTVVSDEPVDAMCRQLTVTIDWDNAQDGYAITLTPP